MQKRNIDIRTLARVENLKHWQIAEQLGISEITFSRWLRTELDSEKKELIKTAIREIKEREES